MELVRAEGVLYGKGEGKKPGKVWCYNSIERAKQFLPGLSSRMLKRETGTSVKMLSAPNGQYREHQNCEIVRESYQIIHQSGLDKFTVSFVDSLMNDVNTVVHNLEHLPEVEFKELIEVIDQRAG